MKSYTEEKRIRPDILTSAVFWSICIMMFFNIISVRIFGDMGAGFCSIPNTLFFLLYISFVLAAQKSVYVMVRLRARRSQFLNAETNMKRSMRMFSLAGIVLALILGLGSFSIARNVLGSGKVYFQLIIVAASLLLLCPQGVLRGYLQGLGYTKPIVISDLLISVTSFISGGIISWIMYTYGKKVNDLFHGDEYSAIYGASGMMIGLLIGSLVGFFQIVISYTLRKKEIAGIVKNGAPRYLDNKNDVYTSIRPIIYLYASALLMLVVDNVTFNLLQIKAGNADGMMESYGALGGRIVSFVILISFLCCIPFIKSWNRVMARIERDELEGARDRLRRLLHYTYMLLIPVFIAVFAAADSIQIAIFGKSSAEISGLFRLASVMILLLSLGVMISWHLNHMGKNTLLTINLSIAWAVHIGLLVLLSILMGNNLRTTVIAEIAALLVYDILCMFMLLKMLKLRGNLLFNVGIPFFASGISGLILLAIDKIFVNLIGEILTVVIGLIIFTVVYMVLMVVLRGVRTHELDSIPLGRLFVSFSARIQHDSFYEE
ncbi:polysaccharide biosynthesis C-terminal domain-containing protein [Butyrivibrio sp. VCB2006]|uniref:polysaccharide biosynthesis C-terminal domain-containing protein n=1 Tax=Butyrivibrio sp. VCB2006 TaxID=1280679 RepID=UPI0003FC136B|nr:polysaccharide biosynthesis C-terminal domain-containing protein [Butyrivibrio sp. VCB2006]